MKISKLIPCAFIAAACMTTLTLSSCGGSSSSSSSDSSSEESANLLEPYTVTLMLEGEKGEVTEDGSYPELDMVPTTESEGTFTSTFILDALTVTSATFKWITLPSADSPHAELETAEQLFDNDPFNPSSGSRTINLTLTFTDPRSATATAVFTTYNDVTGERKASIPDVKVLFSAPMY